MLEVDREYYARFSDDYELEVFENDNGKSVLEFCRKGLGVEFFVIDQRDGFVDIQFADGSVAMGISEDTFDHVKEIR